MMPKESTKQWIARRRGRIILLALLVGVLVVLGNRRPAPPRVGEQFNEVEGGQAGRFEGDTFTVMTYNIHSGKGEDDVRDLDRTAKVIEGADFVGLNEVSGPDWFETRNQAQKLGEKLSMPWLFAPTEYRWLRGDFGNGVLSRMEVDGWIKFPLPSKRGLAMRNAVITKVRHPKGDVHIIVTHVANNHDDPRQVKAVVDLFLAMKEPAILMGDLNNDISNPLLQEVVAMEEVGSAIDYDRTDASYIDWLFYKGLECVECEVIPRGVSDHPAIRARMTFPDK